VDVVVARISVGLAGAAGSIVATGAHALNNREIKKRVVGIRFIEFSEN
jgi:hypothetical protein